MHIEAHAHQVDAGGGGLAVAECGFPFLDARVGPEEIENSPEGVSQFVRFESLGVVEKLGWLDEVAVFAQEALALVSGNALTWLSVDAIHQQIGRLTRSCEAAIRIAFASSPSTD